MKNKILILFLLSLLFLNIQIKAYASYFSDVPDDHTYVNEIDYVKITGFVTGYSDGTFKPDNKITRAELTKIVTNAKNIADLDKINLCMYVENSNAPFDSINTDVADYVESVGYYIPATVFTQTSTNTRIEFYELFKDIPGAVITNDVLTSSNKSLEFNKFTKYICNAKVNSIVKGYSDGTYKPQNNVTFGEAAKIIVRALDLNHGIDVNAELKEYVLYLNSKDSVPLTLNPTLIDRQITRGEVAYLIQMTTSDYKTINILKW